MKSVSRRSAAAKSKPLSEHCEQPSLFAYYCMAAKVAARLGIGLDYAFKRYVKPHIIEDAPLLQFSAEEFRDLFGSGEVADVTPSE